eukprot:15343802-Ditylum_brightwellii.AAC.1
MALMDYFGFGLTVRKKTFKELRIEMTEEQNFCAGGIDSDGERAGGVKKVLFASGHSGLKGADKDVDDDNDVDAEAEDAASFNAHSSNKKDSAEGVRCCGVVVVAVSMLF